LKTEKDLISTKKLGGKTKEVPPTRKGRGVL